MKSKTEQIDSSYSDTKLSLTLGGDIYNLSFGVFAQRRIQESKPGFNILSNDVSDFEIIPFLIQCAIEPEDHKWKSEKEFIALYEECTDEINLQKIPLAYQNALGFTSQRFAPLITRLTETVTKAQQEAKKK